jgi:hypothetical protein
MLNFTKLTDRLDADPLGGRVSGHEVRVFGFEFSQLTRDAIIFGIRNYRMIENEIGEIVLSYRVA